MAYPGSDGAAYVVARRGGAPKKLCDNCTPGDWTNDGRQVITNIESGGRQINLVDVGSGETRLLLDSDRGLNRPHLSPDNRWLAFRSQSGSSGQIFVSPFRPGSPPPVSEWVAITDPRNATVPTMRMVTEPAACSISSAHATVFVARILPMGSREGRARTGAARWSLPQLPQCLQRRNGVISTGAGNAVMNDQILFDLPTNFSNIWTMRLPLSVRP